MSKLTVAQKNSSSSCQIELNALPCVVRKGRFEISDSGTYYSVITHTPTLASRLNRITRRYPVGTVFKPTDECLFKVPKTGPLRAIANALKLKA